MNFSQIINNVLIISQCILEVTPSQSRLLMAEKSEEISEGTLQQFSYLFAHTSHFLSITTQASN